MLHIQRMISLSLDGGSSLTFQPIRVKTNLDWNVEIVRRFALTPIHSCRLTQTQMSSVKVHVYKRCLINAVVTI